MMAGRAGVRRSSGAPLASFFAAWLADDDASHWRAFAQRVPWASYQQDPAWAPIEECGERPGVRKVFHFWSERAGEICLTALGVRRRLPLTARAFWEFNKGPTFVDVEVLDAWLAWLVGTLRRDAARIRIEPAMPLATGGDDVETLLERHGFVRRRSDGTWSTVMVDLRGDEEQLLASLSAQTRRKVKKSRLLGIAVRAEDSPSGWRVLSGLERELSRRAAVSPVDVVTLSCISRQWLKGGTGGTLLVAYRGEEPLAAGLVIAYRDTAYLPLIACSPSVRDLPLSHLLVWEALEWARHHGRTVFDLEGYSQMARPGDVLWGVNQFKRGFAQGRQPTKAVAIHELVFSPALVTAAGAVRSLQAKRRVVARGGGE